MLEMVRKNSNSIKKKEIFQLPYLQYAILLLLIVVVQIAMATYVFINKDKVSVGLIKKFDHTFDKNHNDEAVTLIQKNVKILHFYTFFFVLQIDLILVSLLWKNWTRGLQITRSTKFLLHETYKALQFEVRKPI